MSCLGDPSDELDDPASGFGVGEAGVVGDVERVPTASMYSERSLKGHAPDPVDAVRAPFEYLAGSHLPDLGVPDTDFEEIVELVMPAAGSSR
jgi:hypothetical protein